MFSGRAISCEACVYMIAHQKESEAKKEIQQGVVARMTGEERISDGYQGICTTGYH